MPDSASLIQPAPKPALLAGVRKFLARSQHVGLLLSCLALAVLLSGIVPGFATVTTLQSMMFQIPQLGLLTMAMMIPLMSGGLNLAVIAAANASALVMVGAMKTLTPVLGAGAIPAALLAGFVISLMIGTLIGVLIARTSVHPILVTLGAMSVIQGVCLLLTHGSVISGVPPLYAAIGNAVILSVPVPFILFAVAAIVLTVLLRWTAFGTSLALTGSNPEATRYSAVDIRRVYVKVYALSGVFCFLASTLMVARFNSASAAYAKSYLLMTVLASVLGGVDPFGGFGTVGGLMLALIMLQMIATGCNLAGLSDYLTLAIWGLTLIAVTAMGMLRRK